MKDFYKVWDSEVFFLAIEDSLLINFYYSNKNYFKIPAAKTRMKKDMYFLFDFVTDVPDARSDHRRYDYIKYTFVDPDIISQLTYEFNYIYLFNSDKI
ncbi:DUF5960 family protein [Enterococcus sp. DIV0180]|uniref:DUF5960 family protein n=1 Tax=Enterococcus sp. DIV0180 TaxID=2774749 RepID=UPI003D2FE07E